MSALLCRKSAVVSVNIICPKVDDLFYHYCLDELLCSPALPSLLIAGTHVASLQIPSKSRHRRCALQKYTSRELLIVQVEAAGCQMSMYHISLSAPSFS